MIATMIPMLMFTSMAMLDDKSATAAFKAGGFVQQGRAWRGSGCREQAPAYDSARIDIVHDLNGDGRLDAIIVEDSATCYGAAGRGYTVVGQVADGQWRKLTSGNGMVEVLDTRGAGGWPDLEIGGPGFCFPVHRWNGKAYVLNRRQYSGKPCR